MSVTRTVTPSDSPSDGPTVTVVVVDRSADERRFLRCAIEAEPQAEVVGEARNGREAVALVERLRPNAVVMELDLPGMNGLEVIERVMALSPTPILVCSAEGDAEQAAAALAAGAVDIVRRPAARQSDRSGYADAVRRGVRVASRVRVITHPRGKLRVRGLVPPEPVRAPVAASSASVDQLAGRRPRFGAGPVTDDAPSLPVRTTIAGAGPYPAEGIVDLVAIGASTGGPQALAVLLGQIPGDFAPAVVVVQHMADGFIEGLASWLDNLCALPVGVARSGVRLQPGTVAIAPSARNLLVHDHLRITIENPPPTQFHVPGVDVTFESVAASVGPRAIGVLLTGMGRDGAAGLKAMLERGAITIGQDEETSAVWGMPGAAATIGAVQRQLPLPDIAPELVRIVRGSA